MIIDNVHFTSPLDLAAMIGLPAGTFRVRGEALIYHESEVIMHYVLTLLMKIERLSRGSFFGQIHYNVLVYCLPQNTISPRDCILKR